MGEEGATCGSIAHEPTALLADAAADWEPMTPFEDWDNGCDDNDYVEPPLRNRERVQDLGYDARRYNKRYQPDWCQVRTRLKVHIGDSSHPGSRNAWKKGRVANTRFSTPAVPVAPRLVDHGWGPQDYIDHKGPYCENRAAKTGGKGARGGARGDCDGDYAGHRARGSSAGVLCNCDPSQQPLRGEDFEALRADAWRSLAHWGWGARLFPVAHHVVHSFMAHSASRLSVVFHGASARLSRESTP
jgi:hypothetical protein